MALNAYLKLKGHKQGDIKGSVTQKGREGKILVIAAAHEITSPRDAASGLATGKRMHRPFVITKEIDAASPLLYTMLSTSELSAEWELQFWAASTTSTAGSGAEVQRYTVRLTDASISNIRFCMPNTRDPDLKRYAEYEEVSFSYAKIEWLWVPKGLVASDSWGAATTRVSKKKVAGSSRQPVHAAGKTG
jgi:type VI secretion system secreted protein Hcp